MADLTRSGRELCSPATALAARCGGVVGRIMLQLAAWDRRPVRIGVGGVVVWVGWFTSLDAAFVIRTGQWICGLT